MTTISPRASAANSRVAAGRVPGSLATSGAPAPGPAAQPAYEVSCPGCFEPAFLVKLRRPGAYRLVDPDGGSHLAVCPVLERRPSTRLIRGRRVRGPWVVTRRAA